MHPLSKRAEALTEKAQLQAGAALPYVRSVVTRATPEGEDEHAMNAQAQHLLDEQAAGRLRIGHHIRIVRTAAGTDEAEQ